MAEIRLEGLEEVLAQLDFIGNNGLAICEGLEKSCALIERAARKNAPKGHGELRRSISSKVSRVGDEYTGIVFTPLEYAPYVEYGTGLYAEEGGRQDVPWCYKDDKGEWHTTKGQHPHPFMRPALYENREKILKILAKAFSRDEDYITAEQRKQSKERGTNI